MTRSDCRRGCKPCPTCTARHTRTEPCPTCPLCAATRADHPLNNRGQTLWCTATDATWPAANLIAKAGNTARLCELLGISRGSVDPWLTDEQADRWAVRCGWHPEQVWPGWCDAGLRYVDRVFIEDGGWRQTWLHLEPNTVEQAA